MGLKEFERAIVSALKGTNLQLSGVAKVFNGHIFVYSASFSVSGEGKFPSPSDLNYIDARTEFQRFEVCGYRFHQLYFIQFIMQPDLESVRWQAQYSEL